MKLTKKSLVIATRERLLMMGYKEVKDSITGAQGLFVKCPIPNFFLCLGFTISRLYDHKFTADFYLSKTTLWGAGWGDIPPESYRRISFFLTIEERKLYLDEEYNSEDEKDGWWRSDSDRNFSNFIETVKITEERFLGQESLFIKVENSVEVKELVDYVSSVFEIIHKGVSDKLEYEFIPDKNIDDIPIEWFKAAETTLKNKAAILNKNTVKRLAADAWRQEIIK